MVLDNFGIASFGFYVDFYIDEKLWHRRWVRWIPTHGSITMNVTFKNLSYGYHNLKCIIDAEDVVPEMRETNNTFKMIFRVNRPPYVGIEVNSSETYMNETVVFYGYRCYDPDGEIISYFWDFGDGTLAEGQNASHRYSERGIYNVTLRVMDNDGVVNMTSIFIYVVNRPPVVNLLNNKSITAYVNDTLNFSAFGTYDLDNDTLNFIWDFGDGNTSTEQNPEHTYASEGPFIVTLEVMDDQGLSDTVSKEVYPYSIATVRDVYAENIYAGESASVGASCNKNVSGKLEVFSEKTGQAIFSLNDYICNSGPVGVGPLDEAGIYCVHFRLNTARCAQCSGEKCFTVRYPKPEAVTPELHPALIMLIAASILLLLRVGKPVEE